MTAAAVLPADLPVPGPARWGTRATLAAVRDYHLAGIRLRDEVGRISQLRVGPAWLPPGVAPRFVMVSSAQGAHDALAANDGSIDKYGALHERFRELGTNVFNLAHQDWLPRRRALQPVFSKPTMAEYAGAMTEVASETAASWAAQGRVDLQDGCRGLASEVLGRSLLGLRLGHRAAGLAADAATYMDYAISRGRRPVNLPLWVPTASRRAFARALDGLYALCDEAIDRALREPEHAAPVLRQLLSAVDPETGAPLTRDEMRRDLVVFLIAGHDTTATTVAYALWELGRRPEWQERLATEVQGIGDRPIAPADVHDLPVTVRVVQEALRLCPPAAGVARMAVRDVVIDGHRVPAGWNIVVNAYALHRDPEAWTDPDEFDPDRFLPERSVGRSRWQFIPFGAGPRSCIGDHFAMLEATIAVATLVRDVTLVSDGDFRLQVGFTTQSAGPVPALVAPRLPPRVPS